MPYSISLQLPWPPSANHYWRHVGSMVKISAEGRKFRESVTAIVARLQLDKLDGRLAVYVRAYPPDKRRRDLDNLNKSLLDAMQHAGVYDDDGKIDWLLVERGGVKPGGAVEVEVREIESTWLERLATALRQWWKS